MREGAVEVLNRRPGRRQMILPVDVPHPSRAVCLRLLKIINAHGKAESLCLLSEAISEKMTFVGQWLPMKEMKAFPEGFSVAQSSARSEEGENDKIDDSIVVIFPGDREHVTISHAASMACFISPTCTWHSTSEEVLRWVGKEVLVKDLVVKGGDLPTTKHPGEIPKNIFAVPKMK